jgi:RNA polymerase sigma factor (sigma-70 family)
MEQEINKTIDHLFRHESGKMVSVLCRLLGFEQIETAQDIVQDTLLQAMNTWAFSGLPAQPSAWLYKAAKNKAIDFLRRNKTFKNIAPRYAHIQQSEYNMSSTVYNLFLEGEIEDSQLRMMFACCHPAIPEESRVALVLKTLCGLSTHEIAKAFLTNDETIGKRIYRAKEKIRNENIQLDVPSPKALPARLDNILQCLYLLFNEGYNSSHTDKLIREDLCADAMRLCKLLSENKYAAQPKTFALLSLMCFHASRFTTRLDNNGSIVLLKYQDRSRWNYFLIKKGNEYIDKASAGNEISQWHIEAAIASLHASAGTFEETDWKEIYSLYILLCNVNPSPVAALNKAIAACYAIGYSAGLDELISLHHLEKNHLYHAALGEVYLHLDKKQMAKECFNKAIHLTTSAAEIQLLQEKMKV